MRRMALVLAALGLALVLASGVAWALNEVGTDGPDTLRGTNGADNLAGRGGNDAIFSLAGKDHVLGGPGKDFLLGGKLPRGLLRPLGGDKNIAGGPGNDAVFGGTGADDLSGVDGNDWLSDGAFTESSEDNLSGGGGDDVLDAINRPAFRDNIVCGSGFDRVRADREDVVGPDCEKVALGDAAAEQLVVPQSFFEGLNPRFFG